MLANVPMASVSNLSSAAVASTTSATGRHDRLLADRDSADYLGLADEPSRQVVEVGGLLDDLAAASRFAPPPRGSRRLRQPARRHESRRIPGKPLADFGHRLEAAQVVADRRHQAALQDRGRDPGRAGSVCRGERFLGQERDASFDELFADRDRRRRRDADVGDVRSALVEQPPVVVEGGDATRPGRGLGALQPRRRDADELGPPEAIERGEVRLADPACADQRQAQIGAGSLRGHRSMVEPSTSGLRNRGNLPGCSRHHPPRRMDIRTSVRPAVTDQKRGGAVTRIVLVGAGSVEFTRNLLGDILTSPALRSSQIALHDIDPERLATAKRMARWTAAALGADPTISAHLDRREALQGADFVVNTIQVGGARATQLDFDVPARFGLRYTIADTIGVGGVFRGLRTIPVVLGIARDMQEICPDAWLLNYTNPLAILVRAVSEATAIRVVGLCHSVFWTIDTIAGYLGLPREEIDAASAGVNHLAFLLRLEHRGRDLYPQLRAFVEAGKTPDDDLVRAELFRRLGFYPTESSEHHAEYSPWYIGKRDASGDAIERFHIPIGEYLDRVSHNLDEYAETKRMLDAGEPFEIERSGEYAATIAEAMTTGAPARIVVNAINGGALIPNLDAGACVEVPGLVDGLGVHPVAMGPLPLHLAAYVHGAVDMQG